LKRLAISL